MNKSKLVIIVVLIVIDILLILANSALLLHSAIAHGEGLDYTSVNVTASILNGRSEPNKKASVEARFDHGDILQAIGWSKNHHWIEVKGGETGTVWVWWEYIDERDDDSRWLNDYGSKVKIRREPFGRVTGYLKNGGEIAVDQIALGWGHCSQGWVDLSYLTEED